MVVAGCANYTGAACLAASAAMRVGAGLVTLGVAELLYPMLASKLSEATFLLLPHEMGALVPQAVKVLQAELSDYDAVLLGPGLGRDEKTVEFVAQFLGLSLSERQDRLGFLGPTADGTEGRASPLPCLVIDADGLSALSRISGWRGSLSSPAVLTPHPGEMARLLGTTIASVEGDRVGTARRAAREWKTVVVLKGAYTVIASPQGRTCINPFANPALATAGTGDVLAGTIAGLLVQGLPPFEAAVSGAYLHGLAGEMVSKELGPAGVVAGDLLAKLPLSMQRVVAV
jgi:NAD(P)H-hydrate epimerase